MPPGHGRALCGTSPSIHQTRGRSLMATTLAQYIRARGRKSSRTAFLRSNHRPARAINVGTTERLLSLLAGGVLATYGLSRGKTSGLLLAGAGAALAYRGAT